MGIPMTPGEQQSRETLNPYQSNRLRVTCRYIDKLLAEIEDILNTTSSKAAFPRYVTDILPVQRRTIEDYIARVRVQLIRILEGQGIPLEKASIPVSRAVHVHLGAIDIAVDELKPKYMRGYGEVPESVAIELNGIVGELSGLVHRFDRYLSEGVGQDLKARLERLEASGNDLTLLRRIEQTVRDGGLVEFRSAIASVLDRAEDKSFEIAVFGRVSSGKSSLLNAILEMDVLPVGVTPITAVPTHLTYADQPLLTVWFSEAPRKELEVSHLREFATEQENPGNAKHVVQMVLALPAARLRSGVSFVDTPGLGSLATSGTSETLAYLPRCDLGMMLIDSGSILTADDLKTIMMLREAAIPVNVLLSKADLLGADDRQRIVRYIKENIYSECKFDVPVNPVSVVPSCREMLNDWFKDQLVPLYARSQELRAVSLRRKIGALRDSVAASLQARIKRSAQSSATSRERIQLAEALLRRTMGRIEEIRVRCSKVAQAAAAEAARGTAPGLAEEPARRLVHAWSSSNYGVVVPGQLVRDSVSQLIEVEARKLQSEIVDLARQLGTNLRQCAADLGLPDFPTDNEFESLVRGAPVFECPAFAMSIPKPIGTRLFRKQLMMRWLIRKISRRLPAVFYKAVENFWILTGEWATSMVAELRQKFDSYAENYRAQAGQALGDRQFTKDEILALQRSLAELNAAAVANRFHGADAAHEVSAPQEKAL